MVPPQNRERRWRRRRRPASATGRNGIPPHSQTYRKQNKMRQNKSTEKLRKKKKTNGSESSEGAREETGRTKKKEERQNEETGAKERDVGLSEAEPQSRQRLRNLERQEIVERASKRRHVVNIRGRTWQKEESQNSLKSGTISGDRQDRRLEVKEKKRRKGNRPGKKGTTS